MKIDWTNLDDVIKLANKFGKGMPRHDGQTVMRTAGSKSFGLTHTERRDIWDRPNVTVLYQTI
jgi:hypothetical protein